MFPQEEDIENKCKKQDPTNNGLSFEPHANKPHATWSIRALHLGLLNQHDGPIGMSRSEGPTSTSGFWFRV
jgi:hypothetical protein